MTALSALTARAQIAARYANTRILRRGRYDDLPEPDLLNEPGVVECLPALFDPDQLARVRSTAFSGTIYDEVHKLTTTRFYEGPLLQYRLGPATIVGGSIFSSAGVHFFGSRSVRRALRSPMQQLRSASVVSSEQGVKYFGHWLRDDCPLFEWMRDRDITPWALTRPDWHDRHLYEAAFEQVWTPLDFAQVEDLTLYRDQRFHREKGLRLRRLRDRLRAAYPEHTGGHAVYLSRGSGGAARNMSNAPAFEAAMDAAGIRVVRPEGSSPEDLAAELLNARMIITIEGSQAAHGVYMLADEGAMLVLQPPDRFYNPHHEWSRLLGMRYGTVIGTRDENGFRVDPAEVLTMAERLDKAPRGSDL